MADKKYFGGYFKKIEHNGLKVVNLSQRSVFIRNIKEDSSVIGEYQVREGETAWSLAWDFYGDVDYYWIILHLNDIVDPFFGWVLSSSELDRLVDIRYGSDRNAIHHWVYQNRIYHTDPGHPLAFPISNYEHEDIENEKKRIVKILRPEFIGQAIKDFERSMR